MNRTLPFLLCACLLFAAFFTGKPAAQPEKKAAIFPDDAAETVDKSTPAPDSARAFADSASVDTTDSLAAAAPPDADSASAQQETEEDTLSRVWHHPYWHFGFGWELGSMPVFDIWQKSVINTSLLRETFNAWLTPDTILSVTILDRPTAYSVCFPLSAGFTPVVSDHSLLSFDAAFFWLRKHSNAVFRLDSTTSASLEQSLSLKAVTLGVKYRGTIPLHYFSIDKFERSSLYLGVSGSPLVVLRQWLNADDVHEEKKNSYGTGAGWHAGLTMVRRLADNRGLEAGVIYSGTWHGRFKRHDRHITRGDLYRLDDNPKDALQFISQRFVISFSVLRGKGGHPETKPQKPDQAHDASE